MFVLFQRAEENAHAFLDKELKKLWRTADRPQHFLLAVHAFKKHSVLMLE